MVFIPETEEELPHRRTYGLGLQTHHPPSNGSGTSWLCPESCSPSSDDHLPRPQEKIQDYSERFLKHLFLRTPHYCYLFKYTQSPATAKTPILNLWFLKHTPQTLIPGNTGRLLARLRRSQAGSAGGGGTRLEPAALGLISVPVRSLPEVSICHEKR